MTTTVWVDGEIADAGTARVSALDHGMTVGDGVFETCKVVGGVPFALTRHLARLARSAAALGLPVPDDDAPAGGRQRHARGPREGRRAARLRPAPHHADGRPGAAGLRPSGRRADPGRRRLARRAVARPHRDRHRPLDAQRALGRRGRQDDVVRRERRRPRPRARAGAPTRRSSPTPAASCARAPARTSSWRSTACSSRRRSQRLPRGHHPRAPARVGREGGPARRGAGRASRGAGDRRGRPAHELDPRRAAGRRGRRPRAAGRGAGTAAAELFARRAADGMDP